LSTSRGLFSTIFVWFEKINNFVDIKTTTMKKVLVKVVALVALVGFLASCSQYTCPTYSKKEVKKAAGANRI